MMGYKEICLISVMLLSLAYILTTNLFLIVALVISCILLYQTFQDSKQGRIEYKIWISLSLLVIFTILSVFIFYKPVLAICSIIFYVLQIGIYTVNKHQPHTEEVVLENNKDIEDGTKIHIMTVNGDDIKSFVQEEVSDQLSKSLEIQEIIERGRIATENIELHKRRVSDMEKKLKTQKDMSNSEIEKLRKEKEDYQKLAEETQKEAWQAQEKTSKLHQKMQQKIQESAGKAQKANEKIESYERNIADIKKTLETQTDLSNSEIEKLRQEKENYQKLAEETQEEVWQTQEKASKLHQEMQQEIQKSADKERELENQKELSKEQIEKVKEEIKEYQKLAEFSEEEMLKVQKEKEQLSEQLNITKDELQAAKKIAAQKSEKRTKELEQRWKKAYSKLEFTSGVIKDVNKNFEYNEFGDIEKVLNDISGAEDPHTLINNRGKMNNSREEDHIGFSIPSGFPCRVFYKLIRGNAREKKVLITKIVKHNDPRYGK